MLSRGESGAIIGGESGAIIGGVSDLDHVDIPLVISIHCIHLYVHLNKRNSKKYHNLTVWDNFA